MAFVAEQEKFTSVDVEIFPKGTATAMATRSMSLVYVAVLVQLTRILMVFVMTLTTA